MSDTRVTEQTQTNTHVRFLESGSLEDFQACIAAIYALPDDRLFSLTDLLANQERFTMRALKGIRKGDQEKLQVNLLVAFSWTIAVCNRLHIDISDCVWRRFPYSCSYCGQQPCACKKQKPAGRAVVIRRHSRKPTTLAGMQHMCREIYPPKMRTLADAGVHLAEETGEMSEAAHWYLGEHKKARFDQLENELADWISCMFGVANSADIDVANELAAMYRRNCHVCHEAPCVCSFSTVGKFES